SPATSRGEGQERRREPEADDQELHQRRGRPGSPRVLAIPGRRVHGDAEEQSECIDRTLHEPAARDAAAQAGLPVRRPARRREGIVLVVVLFFALLLASTVATFAKIALIDHMIVRNRDARARAEALARGGIRLATALLLEDKYLEAQKKVALDNGLD